MFGKLVGHGQAGFVFENPKNPNTYYKIVALPNKPLRDYGLNTSKATLYAVNQNQAELFFRLHQEQPTIPQLPKVSNFLIGEVSTPLRQNFLSSAEGEDLQHLLSGLRKGQKIAVWEMEKIPCLNENDFCQMYPELSPNNNMDYQNLLSTMLDLGFVVRDVANPENFGFRHDGTQVFYDPIVAPWPITEADELSNPPRYETFVAAFGKDQIPITARAIRNGDYFGWYHGGGVLEAEDDFDEQSFPRQIGAINWYGNLSGIDYYKLWMVYWNELAEIIQEEQGNSEEFSDDEVMEWWYAITPDNIENETMAAIDDFGQEDLQESIDYSKPTSKLYWRHSAAPVSGLLRRKDRSFLRWLSSSPLIVDCENCDEGIVTHTTGEYDEHEWTENCEYCDGAAEYYPDNADNKWYVKNKERLQ